MIPQKLFAPLVGLVLLVMLGCSTDDESSNGTDDTPRRLAISPGALLMVNAGERYQLSVLAHGSGDQVVELHAPVTWTSSHPETVEVSPSGELVAAGAVGSTQIVAHAGELESTPITVLVARTVPGAILVDDARIEGPVRPTGDSTFDVTLHGVSGLAPGVVVISREEKPLVGRVVAVAGDEVSMEVVNLDGAFSEFRLDERYAIPREPFEPATATLPAETGGVSQTQQALVDKEFAYGPFKCKVEVLPKISTAFPLQVKLEPDIDVDFVVDFSKGKLQHHRFVLIGSLLLIPSGAIETTGTFAASVKCEVTAIEFPLPVGGAFSFLIAPTVPFGVGIAFDGNFTIAQTKFGIKGKAGATTSLGYDYTAAGGFQLVNEFNAIRDLEPFAEWPGNLTEDIRVKLGAQLYGILKLAVTSFPLLTPPLNKRVELLEATFGPRFELEYGTESAQATDTAFASKYGLMLRVRGGVGSTVRDAFKILGKTLELAPPQITLDLPISSSPLGSMTVSQPSPAVDETVTFTIKLDPDSETFLTVPNVGTVFVKRLLPDGTLQEIGSRPGVIGQHEYDIAWTPTSDDVGSQKFYAFVRPTIFGLDALPALELKTNSLVTVSVHEPDNPPPLPKAGIYRYLLGKDDCTNGNYRVLDLFPNGAVTGSPLNDGECKNEAGVSYLAPIGSWKQDANGSIQIDFCNYSVDRSVTLVWDAESGMWRGDDEQYIPGYKACLLQLQEGMNPGSCVPSSTCVEITGFVCNSVPVQDFTLVCSGYACCDCVQPDDIPSWMEQPVTCY